MILLSQLIQHPFGDPLLHHKLKINNTIVDLGPILFFCLGEEKLTPKHS